MTVFLLKKRINEFTFTRPFSYVRVYLSAGLRHKCPLYNTRHRNSLTPYTAEAIIVPHRMKLLHWPLMGGLLHLVQRGRDWAGPQPAQAPLRCTKCNSPPMNGRCTNHRIAILYCIVSYRIVLYCPLLCGFNLPIKG